LKLMINRPVLTRRELRQPCVARYAPGGDRVVLLFEESSGSLRRGQMWRLGKDKCFCFVPHGILSWGAARVPLHVPSRKSMLQTHARFKCKIDIGNNRLQLYAPFSPAQSLDSLCGSLEIWDLGLRWWIDGQGARLIHPPFSRLRRPLRERCKPGLLRVGLVRI
jgi:hypothetical protein